MVAVLRRFLYLDSELTGEFLAQLEGGRYTEEEQSRRGESGRELGGGLAAGGLTAKAGKGSASEEASSRKVQQTPESEFARLAEALQASDSLQFLDALDEAIWNQINRGEILEIEAEVSVSSLHKLGDLMQSFGEIKKLAELAGEDLQVDAETEAGLQAISALGEMNTKIPVTARAAGSPDFKFIASLTPSNMRVESDELEGESTLVAKVQRKLRAGETHTLFDAIPGLAAIPAAQRTEMIQGLENSPEFPDIVVPAPAAVVTPIAIFR